MLGRIFSCAVIGLEGVVIEVEVDKGRGLPKTTIVGLPDTAVQESRERVWFAIKNSGYFFPRKQITVNLAPASVRKAGPAFDLPIAVGILIAVDLLDPTLLEGSMVIGELSLDGSVRHVRGILPMAAKAREAGFQQLFVSSVDAAEAALIPDIDVIPVQSLAQMIAHLEGNAPIRPQRPSAAPKEIVPMAKTNFREIKGQEHVKRALEIAAAGNHNLIMSGPPGAGKTLLARALPGILPSMSIEEALDVTRIYSIADQLPAGVPLVQRRPFRAPHHTISQAGLVGGGNWPQPGEISLAHRGVLFLDEFVEFSPRVLEVMRQPIEDKLVTISRARGSLTFPANFMLVAAMNPCPCGFYGSPHRECTCAPSMVTRYQKRISGPMLDRIDIHVEVPRVDFEQLSDDRLGEPSELIRGRVEKAREMQRGRFDETEKRFGKNVVEHYGIVTNAEMGPAEVRNYCAMDASGQTLLRTAMTQLQLSARAYHRVLKLSRTIADLAGAEIISPTHIAEALQYRPKGNL